MQLAEGYRWSETPRSLPPAVAAAGTGRARGSIRCSPALAEENCEDFSDRGANVKLNGSTAWTDEKHSLYLDHLEVSFVKHLHKSMGLLAQCSEQNKRDKSVWRMNPKVYNLKCISTEFHPASDNMQECLTLSGLENCSQQFSASNRYHEGTGQNFEDEDDQNESDTDSQVKRLKTGLAD